jgi:hypothetical protein
MWRVLLLSISIVGALSAQIIGRPGLPPSLAGYLELTQSQQEQIVQANRSLAEFNLTKARRSAQVQAEIQMELAKADPDPMALGVRYRELEAIRRENAAEQSRAVQTVQAVLTPAQKQKVATLQEALKLYSTACDAVNWNLIVQPPPFTVPTVYDPASGSISSILLGTLGGTCGTTGMRTGDFTFLPGITGAPAGQTAVRE